MEELVITMRNVKNLQDSHVFSNIKSGDVLTEAIGYSGRDYPTDSEGLLMLIKEETPGVFVIVADMPPDTAEVTIYHRHEDREVLFDRNKGTMFDEEDLGISTIKKGTFWEKIFLLDVLREKGYEWDHTKNELVKIAG